MATDYTYLYEEYPEVISADQLYRICHISKRKAKWLLEHGYIPCEDSGKKTRRYKIRLNDVIDYLRTLEAAPDLVATPVGAFNVKRKQLNLVAQMGELVFFIIKPTNISVLPDAGVGARIYALLNVVKGMAEIEMLALNSKESFENNKAFYRQRANEEELPVIRKLLEQDSKHLDRIQVLMASSREFYILVRLQGKKESDVFSYLSRIEKSIKDNGFTVRRATEEDLKRMLGVYFEQNVTTERYEDHDGERWVLFGE